MTQPVLEGKIGIVFGVANKRSIAWAIAQAWAAAGARLIFNYQGERLKENVEELTAAFGEKTPLFPCDVSSDAEIGAFFEKVKGETSRLDLMLHSVAFAPKEALEGDFVSTTREAFRTAHDISAYSLVALAREAAATTPPLTSSVTQAPSPSAPQLTDVLFKNLKARAIGPAIMGGRVSDIAIDPRNPFVFYVALGHGGVFKSGDSGVSFDPIFDKQSALSIGAVAISPPGSVVIWF